MIPVERPCRHDVPIPDGSCPVCWNYLHEPYFAALWSAPITPAIETGPRPSWWRLQIPGGALEVLALVGYSAEDLGQLGYQVLGGPYGSESEARLS